MKDLNVQAGDENLFLLHDFFMYEHTVVWTHEMVLDASGQKLGGSGLIGISKEYLKNSGRKHAGHEPCDDEVAK